MKFIADLHIHSKYSRATSPQMTLEELDRWAHDKGMDVMTTGDFTHPAWIKEIKNKLEPAEPGLFKLKKEFKRPTIRGDESQTRFILTTEVSSIYSRVSPKTGIKRGYRVHNLIFAPDMETVEKINIQLGWAGNIISDGRPILGLDSREILKIAMDANPKSVIIPAHAWTPWFSVFGSMSGFDSIEECFGEYAQYIFAIETGLSSDPAMNWRFSKLDNVALISNSDSHSLPRIGREANIFDTELSYGGIIEAIKSGSPNRRKAAGKDEKPKFVATIEFFPEEGKYHIDGHRLCNVHMEPAETKKINGICPVCGKPLVIGVLNRVEELADRPLPKLEDEGYIHKYENRVPYYSLVPLDEVIAKALGTVVASKKVKVEYDKLIREFGGEFNILMEAGINDLEGKVHEKVVKGIEAIRKGEIRFDPAGYDGEYGHMIFLNEAEIKAKDLVKQQRLF
ncbi:MAG: endonuclease Q family protein [Candidatus Wolfebacteria bacterium]|nr:endonuclease Q family protein [Candidatus Wolfebacteria bacterium]